MSVSHEDVESFHKSLIERIQQCYNDRRVADVERRRYPALTISDPASCSGSFFFTGPPEVMLHVARTDNTKGEFSIGGTYEEGTYMKYKL